MELSYLPENIFLMPGRYYRHDLWSNVNTYDQTEKKSQCGSPGKIDEKNCHICKEKRRKSLSDYIRTKSRRDSEPKSHLREEDEEDYLRNETGKRNSLQPLRPLLRFLRSFTPYSASLLFGLSLVAILVKHPELYPCWLRRVNVKIMFLYELFVSLVFIEIGFCVWNSLETFIFFKVPAFFEEHCFTIGEYYIHAVESPIGVSVISNLLAVTVLFFILHVTKVCNFSLLFKSNGLHKFFADAGLTSKVCRHHREMRESRMEYDNCSEEPVCAPPTAGRSIHSTFSRNIGTHCYNPKMLRSGKKIY